MLSLIIDNSQRLISGLGITISLTAYALVIGFILATALVFGLESKCRWVRGLIQSYVLFIRGTPALVQFFLVYFGSAEATWLHNTFLWTVLREPFACAVLALAMNSSAYSTELLRGAIAAIPKGELEACRVLGMSRLLMLRRILLPRAWRLILPSYSNEVVIVLKTSSLASTITLLDLMGVTRQLVTETYAPTEFFITAGVLYFILNALIMGAFRLIENRYAEKHTLIFLKT